MLRQRIGNIKPRSLRAHEDMLKAANPGIIVESSHGQRKASGPPCADELKRRARTVCKMCV